MANQHTKAADKRLSDQQETFLTHFLQFGNGTAAARAANYAHPEQAANKLLAKPHIAAAVKRSLSAKAMTFAPDMIDVLAAIATDDVNVQPKDRIAAANSVLDRAGLPNGKQGTNISIDASTKTLNVGGAEVARLIAETWQRGRGQTALPAPTVALPEPVADGEFEPVASDDDED